MKQSPSEEGKEQNAIYLKGYYTQENLKSFIDKCGIKDCKSNGGTQNCIGNGCQWYITDLEIRLFGYISKEQHQAKIAELESRLLELEKSENQSKIWKEGFNAGIEGQTFSDNPYIKNQNS